MAETARVAFGYYLRSLRERRGLSLEDVTTLTKEYPEPVSKAYLSRVEHGKSTVSFPRMIALSRVYEVPLEVLAERLELDLELDKRGGPDTRTMSFEELHWAGAKTYFQGLMWEAYAYFRDGLPLSVKAPLLPTVENATEQELLTLMNWSGIASLLGKSRLSLNELEFIRDSGGLPPRRRPQLYQGLASRHEKLGHSSKAKEYADVAIASAKELDDPSAAGYAYSTRGYIALDEKLFEEALRFFEKAHQAFRSARRPYAAAYMLIEIAGCHREMRDFGRAGRFAVAAENLAREASEHHVQARARLLLGDIEEDQGRAEHAARRWREAADIWRKIGNRMGKFRAEFRIYRQAASLKHDAVAESLYRRLARVVLWLPETLDEARSFREIQASRPRARSKRVSVQGQRQI